MLELLPAPPADPLWDLTAEYGADPRPERLNLVLGVYRDQSGVTPVMRAVRDAEIRLAERSPSKEYRGLSGNTAFNQAMLETVLGDEALVARSTAVQTVAGTGALRLLADLVRQTRPGTTVWVSDPAYVNHRPILEAAGLAVRPYRWTDPDGLLTDLALAGRDDVVLVQGCCHNPTGVDPTREQWEALAALAAHAGWVPFVDLAYHGLGDGLEADLWAVRMLAERLPELLVAVSCSKNFGLYADRTGCAIVLGSSGPALRHVETALQNAARTLYSMPPEHGAAIVAAVLQDPALRASWRAELDAMRSRIAANRAALVAALEALGHGAAAAPLARQKGMFAGLPLGPGQMAALRRDHAVYGTSSGRINIAGLPADRVPQLARGIAAVLEPVGV
ncbi:aromatic amino acid transaminase [Streptomyces sp. CC228A]|uniref:amino acid aminotransferase n=1 Tax=Streptomyces sp. CC228A TaxID=2898186 RepID=UPI001F162E3C|nr:aromatic amino acid transaminase [Streptomyces sp. CC228A]